MTDTPEQTAEQRLPRSAVLSEKLPPVIAAKPTHQSPNGATDQQPERRRNREGMDGSMDRPVSGNEEVVAALTVDDDLGNREDGKGNRAWTQPLGQKAHPEVKWRERQLVTLPPTTPSRAPSTSHAASRSLLVG